MFSHEDKLVIRKPFWKWKDMYQAYKLDHEAYGNESAFAIHFRMATQGAIDAGNCHPIEIHPGHSALIHNGCLPLPDESGNRRSDTYVFAKEILTRYPIDFILSVDLRVLEKEVGWSKFVFMDRFGNWRIMNEKNGHWDDGTWYSNHSYKWGGFVARHSEESDDDDEDMTDIASMYDGYLL